MESGRSVRQQQRAMHAVRVRDEMNESSVNRPVARSDSLQ
jgi:hypothetical protein